jgi:hypothetical protein
MKRREFLVSSAAGLVVPALARAQTTPCPPPTLSVDGGATVNTTCSSSTSVEADWIARSTGPGVVWFHDFRSAAEVNAFRWSGGYSGGNDPLAKDDTGPRVRHITTDGVTPGGCLEIFRPGGSGAEGTHWIRPFAPLTAPGNGKTANDPAANGTVTVRSWNPTDGGSQTSNFKYGWYGHPSVQDANFDGNEFWLQMRVKRDPRRVTGGNESFLVGKHLYLSIVETGTGAPRQELVVYSNGGGGTGVNRFRIYGGWAYFTALDEAPNTDGTVQPGGVSPIWTWNSGSWDTVMYHLIMGRTGIAETRIEVYGAHAGEKSFTKFWDQTFAYQAFEVRDGLQALQLSNYNNGSVLPQDYYERWDQIIFSKQPIPCPQV